jgi:hypothetical protein
MANNNVETTSGEDLTKQIGSALAGTTEGTGAEKDKSSSPDTGKHDESASKDTPEKPEVIAKEKQEQVQAIPPEKEIVSEKDDKEKDESEKEEAGPVLLAGRYKTGEELVKASDDLIRKLDLPLTQSLPLNDAFDRLIDKAKSTNDWSRVESFHKQLQSELSKKSAEKTKVKTTLAVLDKNAEDSTQVDEAGRAQQLKKWDDYKAQRIWDKLQADTDLRDRFKRADQAMPRSREELDELRVSNEYLYDRYMDVINDLDAGLEDLRREHFVTIDKSRDLITKERESLQSSLQSMNEKLRLGMSEDQIEADIDAVFNNESPYIYEEKHGVLVPREGGALKYWRAEMMQKYLDTAIKNAETDGRKQHVQDLKTMKDKTTGALPSSSSIPGKKGKTEAKEVSEATVRNASDEDISKKINQIFSTSAQE